MDQKKDGHPLHAELLALIGSDERAVEFVTDEVLDGIWFTSIDDPRQNWVSNRYKALFGYGPDEIEDPAAWWRANIFPEDMPIAEGSVTQALASHEDRFEHVVRFRHKDGRAVWVHCRGYVIRDGSGRPRRLLGCHVDTTRLMELEQVERFGSVIENCIIGIYLIDAATLRFIQVNSGARRRLGYSMAELRTMTPLDVNGFASRTEFEARLSPLLNREVPFVAFEGSNRRKDGSRYPVDIHYELSDGATGTVIVAFISDASEKKQRENELAASREFNEAILDSVSDGIAGLAPVTLDGAVVDFTVVVANHAMRRLLFHFDGALVDAHLRELLPELLRPDLFSGLVDTLQSGRPFSAEIGPTEGGAWLLARAMRAMGTGITLTLVNITDAKQRELTLEKSNAALKQFSAIVSHDLQAPLRHIGLFAEMLQEQLGDGAHGEQPLFLAARVRENAARMQRLISSLLDYTSVAYAQIRQVPVDLDRVVGDALRLIEADIARAGARIEVAHLPTVVGDPDLLQRLFQNLLSNALKYRREDAPPTISVDVVRRKGRWVISVADNGIGIDPHHAQRIFEVFARLHRDEKTYAGMGIGLALCKQIVESHKGEIWLDTRYKGGARFCLSLPAG